MTSQQLFILADESLNNVVAQINDSQWEMVMPDSFATAKKGPVTLREIINYHAYDDAWMPDMMAGKTMAEGGKDKFAGDLLGDKPKQSFAEYVQKAVEAVRTLDDENKLIHFSYGDFPASEALTHVALFRGMRVHDIAQVIGLKDAMPADLVSGLWEMVQSKVEEWRAMGIFGPKIEVPADAPLLNRLLGLTGRRF